MSNATFESPVAASQLFFDWSEQAEVGVAPATAAKKTTARASATASATKPSQPQTAQAAHADNQQSETQQPAAAGANGASTSAQTAASAASVPRQLPMDSRGGHLTFTSDGRIARPVRIGSVMIKLLKRYGITDAEIAEGVASYARKHQQAWAS